MVHSDYTVRFWGVRGSIACPGPDTVRYGGNTSCVEIRCGGHLMVFDGGTGLGMAIVRRIVEDHGGAIDTQSTPGEGTSVTVLLPRQAVRVETAPAPAAQEAAAS